MMDRLKHSIRKLSFSFSNSRRKSSTTNRLSQPTMSKQPSYSTSLLPHATSSVTPTVSLSTGHTLIFNSSIIPPLHPISTSYLSDEDSIHNDYEVKTNNRPGFSRRVSSASSSSGIGLTFGGGMTPMEIIK